MCVRIVDNLAEGIVGTFQRIALLLMPEKEISSYVYMCTDIFVSSILTQRTMQDGKDV